MLGEKLAEHRSTVWLVNTGWTGGAFGEGQRMPIDATRQMLRSKDPATVNLALDMLVEMAADARANPEQAAFTRTLIPEVIAVVKDGEARWRPGRWGCW